MNETKTNKLCRIQIATCLKRTSQVYTSNWPQLSDKKFFLSFFLLRFSNMTMFQVKIGQTDNRIDNSDIKDSNRWSLNYRLHQNERKRRGGEEENERWNEEMNETKLKLEKNLQKNLWILTTSLSSDERKDELTVRS